MEDVENTVESDSPDQPETAADLFSQALKLVQLAANKPEVKKNPAHSKVVLVVTTSLRRLVDTLSPKKS